MSPTTVQSDDDGERVDSRGADPQGEQARERMADAAYQVVTPPPDSNPPLPFVVWPTPPQGLEEVQ